MAVVIYKRLFLPEAWSGQPPPRIKAILDELCREVPACFQAKDISFAGLTVVELHYSASHLELPFAFLVEVLGQNGSKRAVGPWPKSWL